MIKMASIPPTSLLQMCALDKLLQKKYRIKGTEKALVMDSNPQPSEQLTGGNTIP
jgi:hypothetical protein